MKKLKNKRAFIVLTIFLSILILGLFQHSKISYAQTQTQYDKESKTLILPSTFSMYEFSEALESKENISSIDISLPSSTWNLTDIQVNFTDINFNRETKVIENEADASNSIDQTNIKGISVQINITEPIILYGVYVYGIVINTIE